MFLSIFVYLKIISVDNWFGLLCQYWSIIVNPIFQRTCFYRFVDFHRFVEFHGFVDFHRFVHFHRFVDFYWYFVHFCLHYKPTPSSQICLFWSIYVYLEQFWLFYRLFQVLSSRSANRTKIHQSRRHFRTRCYDFRISYRSGFT